MQNTPNFPTPQRRALVTGGTGFIGSHLVRLLETNGWQVHLLTRNSPPFSQDARHHRYSGSIAEVLTALEKSQPDVVFHLASLFIAQHRTEDVDSLVQSNLLLGVQLLEAMRTAGVKSLVNTGTSWQHYGQDTYRPVNLYAATKQAFEDVMAYYCDIGAIRAITLKLFDSYGPLDERRKLLSLLVECMRAKIDLALSAGEQTLDLVHVDDICRAYLHAATLLSDATQPACAAFAVSGNEPRSIREVVALLEEISGEILPVRWGARPYRDREVMELWKGPVLPGWQPLISLRQGLTRLLREQP